MVPGGESRRALMHRGREVLEAIAQGDYRRVIVVSHGAILAAAFKSLLEIPAQRHPFMLENASLSRLEIDGPLVPLHTLNEVAHLSGIGLAGGGRPLSGSLKLPPAGKRTSKPERKRGSKPDAQARNVRSLF